MAKQNASSREIIGATFGWDINEVEDYRYQAGKTSRAIYAVGEHFYAIGKTMPTDLTEHGEVEWELNSDQHWASLYETKMWRTKGEVKKPWREDLQYGYSIKDGWLVTQPDTIANVELTMQLTADPAHMVDGQPKAVKVYSSNGYQLVNIDSIPFPAQTYLKKLYKFGGAK